MRYIIVAVILALSSVSMLRAQEVAPDVPRASIYEISVRTIDGRETTLAEYKGKVLLIVNVASRCGATPQYKGLQNLYTRYQDKGLVVLGFPANDFGRQEPGTNEEICAFATERYAVTFPMFTKISVKGEGKHPLYALLTDKQTNPQFGGEITWNFNKFLIGRDGSIIGRFTTREKPEDEKVIQAIEEALK